MTNRKTIVKTDTYLSNTFPLNNGIPKGSPISFILFLIAYNSLTNIISIPREIKFCAYADDFHFIVEHNIRKNPTTNLTDTSNQIDEWCTHSGSVLSKDKCQILHICRKHNCNAKIITGDTTIPTTDTLKILGLTISKRYKWNTHISKLKADLSKPLSIVKYLSSHKYNTNTASLIQVIKSLVPNRSRHFRVTPRYKGVMSTCRMHGDVLLAGRSRRGNGNEGYCDVGPQAMQNCAEVELT